MSDLYRMAREARAEAIRTDTEAGKRLLRAYGRVYERLSADLDALVAKYEGRQMTAAQLYQEARLQKLKSQALGELQQAEATARVTVRDGIVQARGQATTSAARMVEAVQPPGVLASTVQLPTSAIGQAVALTTPGTPLAALFESITVAGAASVESLIVNGIAAGLNPRVVARTVRESIGGDAVRAMTISRTEIMRAHREGSREEYQRHPNTIQGWVWVAGLGARTCPSCWAQNGTTHPLDEPMATHPNCRCVAAPQSVPWSDLGIDLPEPNAVPYGPDVFARSPESLQRTVLGPSKFDAYQAGEIDLPDLIARRESPTWGHSTSEAGLREARVNAELRRAGQTPEPRPAPVAEPAAPPPPPAPTGAPITDGLDPHFPNAARRAEMNDTLGAIDKIHTLRPGYSPSSNPRLPIKQGRTTTTRGGSYRMRGGMGGVTPVDITVNRLKDGVGIFASDGLTLAHELGHHLDHWHLPNLESAQPWASSDAMLRARTTGKAVGRLGQEPEPYAVAFVDLFRAILDSPTYQRLFRVQGAHGRYMRSPEELFARSYAQWIATRSDEARMIGGIREEVTRRAEALDRYGIGLNAWDADEFAPIADAFDNLFRAAGMLR